MEEGIFSVGLNLCFFVPRFFLFTTELSNRGKEKQPSGTKAGI